MRKIVKGVFVGVLGLLAIWLIITSRERRMSNLRKYDYLIWRDTPVKTLALAVRDQDADQIRLLASENPDWLGYQEPQYGCTLLLWSVGTERYTSAESLLKAGADPDIPDIGGKTPLYTAAGYSWVDNHYKQSANFVILLLEYGADPNLCIPADTPFDYPLEGTSPLMESIGCGIEKTKALIAGGADINHKNINGETAATEALSNGSGNVTKKAMVYATYLVVEKKANITDPYHYSDPTDLRYPVEILRSWIHPLDSEEYRIKMEIVEECTRQGADYWSTRIAKFCLETIQKTYPGTWEEYILVY